MKAGCKAAPHVPSDAIAEARANATRPFMGRLVLMALREFTMGSLKSSLLTRSGLGYDKSDCK